MKALAVAVVLACLTMVPIQVVVAEPAPITEIEVTPKTVVVGQPVRVRLTLLVPNWFTTPPSFPELEVSNAVTRQPADGSVNLTRQIEGQSYAGIVREYLIYPQEPGEYAVFDASVTFAFAITPTKSSQLRSLKIPRIGFTAVIPPAAKSLRPFIAASSLSIGQKLSRDIHGLKVGDAIERKITVRAPGLPAMLLPAFDMGQVAGASGYAGQPEVVDRQGERGNPSVGLRMQSVTYVIKRPGKTQLPPVKIRWWNLNSKKIETAEVRAVELLVAPNPALKSAPGQATGSEAENLKNRSKLLVQYIVLWVLVVIAGGLAGIILASRFHRYQPRIRSYFQGKRQQYEGSELAYFRYFKRATRKAGADGTYRSLLSWLDRTPGMRRPATVGEFIEVSNNAELEQYLIALDGLLFTRKAKFTQSSTAFSQSRLARLVSQARRRLTRTRTGNVTGLDTSGRLNP